MFSKWFKIIVTIIQKMLILYTLSQSGYTYYPRYPKWAKKLHPLSLEIQKKNIHIIRILKIFFSLCISFFPPNETCCKAVPLHMFIVIYVDMLFVYPSVRPSFGSNFQAHSRLF